MEIKDSSILDRLIAEEKGILPTTDTTSTTFTTISIDNWGLIDTEKGILLEQISKQDYLFNIKGVTGLAHSFFECSTCGSIFKNIEKEKIKCSCGANLNWKDHLKLYINGITFKFKNKPNMPLYMTPDLKEVEKYLCNTTINRINTKELFEELVNFLNTLFDFHRPEDVKICALFILFSYVLPYFNSVFYLGIDATKGSGKTTLLEILTILIRHGFLADCSPASIPRLKQKYDLAIASDELDQLKSFEDLQGLLRKGQRRGNKYVRLNKNTLDEEIYEAFGVYLFSFRSILEDAFKSRSVLIRTARAKDQRLSILNMEKETILRPLFSKIFLWYVQNLFSFGSKSSQVVEVVGTFTQDTTQNERREALYSVMVKDFTKEEKEILTGLFGRNSEIGYLFLQVCKFLEIDLATDIKTTMAEKQDEEETPEDYYFELIKGILREDILKNDLWVLSKGDFAGYKYYPKTKFYVKLISKLKELNLMSIGTNKFNSILKDIGFIEGFNIKNQKYEGVPVKSLVFDKSVLSKLNIDYTPKIEPEYNKETLTERVK